MDTLASQSKSFLIALMALIGIGVYDLVRITHLITDATESNQGSSDPVSFVALGAIAVLYLLQVVLWQGAYVYIVYLLKKGSKAAYILHAIATSVVYVFLFGAIKEALPSSMALPVDSLLPILVTLALPIGIIALAHNDYKYKKVSIA